jgi:two-component system response regulator
MEHNLNNARFAEVLLVEDNKDDVILTEQAFKQSRLTINLHNVKNGIDCMNFLRKQKEYSDAPTPDLILLDLNLPIMDGREVLEAISKDESLSHLPVIILTTSEDEKDVYKMYQLRCSSYIVKPIDFTQFLRVVKELSEYWFTVVVLPSLGK